MAITTVNPRYEGFIFDGENSRDYGIYVQDAKVFGAPTRDVEMVSIPGRDGEFVLDKGRFNNIQVVYTCALGTDTQTDFNTGVSDFRNWLASRKGYKRLEDEINTTEYRMAVFKDGLDVSTLNKETGTFEVTFDCKPQRFLKNGEIPRTIGGSVTNTQTESGTVVSLESDGGDKATSLIATIEAVQAGSGDPSPTNVRAITGQTSSNFYVGGKNILRINRVTTTVSGVTFTINSDGSIHVEGTTTANNVFLNLNYAGATKMAIPEGTWKAKVGAGASGNVRLQLISNDVWRGQGGTADFNSITIPEGSYNSWCRLQIQNSGTTVNETLYPMICADTETSGAFKGYDGKFVSVSFGSAGTVYGGTVDVVTGVLTVTHKMVDLGTLTWTLSSASGVNYFRSPVLSGAKIAAGGQTSAMCSAYKPISGTSLSHFLSQNNVVWTAPSNISTYNPYAVIRDDRYTDAASFKSAVSGVNLIYELDTPHTYNLTAHEVELLIGQNNVWADTGDISITYGHDPNKLVNPTLFESRPLLEVDGYGTISINGEDVVLHNEPLGRVQLGGGGSYKNSLTYHFDQSQFNTGDVITVPDYRRTYQFDMVKPYGSGQITDFGQVSQMTAVDYIFTRTKYQGSLTLLTDITTFSVGTAKTEQYSITGILSYDDREETATPATVTATTSVIYDGNDVIRFTAAVTIDEPQDVSSKTVAGNAPNFYGDSTWQPVTDTAYIDLDIGEAYVIQGGSVIGINNIVDLPAELPTLKAGANTVTHDNTITELVILPRWWKV